MSAMAQNHWRGQHGGQRDIGRFHQHDVHRWAGGHWYHGAHNGHLGWWWVVGSVAALETALWYSYPAPVYPYPDPYVPPQMIEAPAPAMAASPPPPPMPYPAPQAAPAAAPAVWYFCRASGKYYPYAANCPEGWQTVPATPAGQ